MATVLEELSRAHALPKEIVLSGGEPTLHKSVVEIARMCKSTGCHLSMASHGGHPRLLKPVLPYLDELKLHIDDFDTQKQQESMGIPLSAVQESIRMAKTHALNLLVNHPLTTIQGALSFVSHARRLGVHVKLIHLLQSGLCPFVRWEHAGYTWVNDCEWLHRDGRHRLYIKNCSRSGNPEPTLFVDADGIRFHLDTSSRFHNRSIREALLALETV